MSKTRFYNIYHGAKSRCEYKKNIDYHLYWTKWIKFEWKSFEEFKNDMYDSYLQHCKKYGEKETTIERIDSNKNYCKENCRRATNKEQSNNTNRNKKLEYKWKLYDSLSKLCEEFWLKYNLIADRLRRWWTIEEAIETKWLKKRLHDKQCKQVIYKWKQYYSIMELARETWVNWKTISRRLLAWRDISSAVETPLKKITEAKEQKEQK